MMMRKTILALFTTFLSVNTIYLPAQINILNFFPLDRQQGLSDNAVTAVTQDADGYMWFGTLNGLNRYDGYEFTHFYAGTDSTSLPENKISRLFLSGSGDLWVGLVSKGICRYNSQSQSFIRYILGDDPYYWPFGIIKGIAETNDSVLYVATNGGLFFLMPGEEEFNSFPVLISGKQDTLPEFHGLLSSSIAAIAPDETDGMWIAYDDWRITHYSGRNNSFRHYSLQDFRKEYQRIALSSMIHYKNRLWLGTMGPGFVVYDPLTGTSEVLLANENLVNIGQISQSLQEGLLWLSTGSGLVNYNTDNGEFYRFTYIRADNRSLSSTTVTSSYEDKHGLIWVGTSNAGLNYAFRDKPFRHLYVGMDYFYSLGEENVSAILHCKNGDMWVGNVGGKIEYNSSAAQQKFLVPIYAIGGPWGPGTIWDLFEDSEGDIYCSSWQGGLQKYDKKTRRFIPVPGSNEKYAELFDAVDIRDIEEDIYGRLWLCVHGKGVYVFNKKEKKLIKFTSVGTDTSTISNDWVFDLCIDDEGFAWTGSAWGLSRISLRDNTVRRYFSYENHPVLTDNSTHLVTRDRQGNIWVGTDYGLNLFNRKKDSFYRFDISNGLPVNQIRSMEQDTSGTYWVSTAEGLFKFDLRLSDDGEPEIINTFLFDKDDGLQSDNFYMSSSSEDYSGLLYFGGTDGIDLFDPFTIHPVKNIPELKIKNFKIFGNIVFPGAPGSPDVNEEGVILLDHKQNMIGIEYAALNYFEAQGNIYSYRLLPLYSGWIDAGSSREIIFSDLDLGLYSLSLRVVSENGLVNEARDIVKFNIVPAFWQTNWFRYLFFLFLAAIIYVITRLYTANLRNKKVQLEKIVSKRTEELLQKNIELEEQSSVLNETNILLVERQQKITEQSEELKVQSDMLARSNKDLSMLNSMKDKLFSIIAHDLKNPFNTLIGFSKLLLNEYDKFEDDKRKQLIGYVHDSVTSAYSLLENLLHWSRSQTNRLNLNPKELPVIDTVEMNLELIRPMLERKNQRFKSDITENLTVWADRELLNTVFRNLISNAVKFTPEGGEITVSAGKTEDNLVHFEVKDTGVGMEQEELENIFRIDISMRKTGTAGEQGTGLGMILCKEFIEKMGGQIWLESSKGKGTSVFFTFPAKPFSKS